MDKNKVISVYDMLRAADKVMKDYDNDSKPLLYLDIENTISDIERLNKDE